MKKAEYSMDALGPYAVNGDSNEGLPRSESKGDQDAIDLAVFGKKAQLKVHPISFRNSPS